jgi:hypothetical protein
LKNIAKTVGAVLGPVFDALIPIIGLLEPLFKALLTALEPIIHLLITILFPILKWLGVIISSIVLGFRYLYIAILEMMDFFVGGYGDEIAKQEASAAKTSRAINELSRTTTESATESVRRHGEANDAGADAANRSSQAHAQNANIVSGYKIARVAYGADRGVANDFISRPGQPIQKFASDDTIVGSKGGGRGVGGTTYEVGEVHIHGIDDPASFWQKIEESIRFNIVRGGTALPTTSRWGGV